MSPTDDAIPQPPRQFLLTSLVELVSSNRRHMPMFADKLELIASYLDRQLHSTMLSLRQRFVCLRHLHQALLKFAFFLW
jgi:hypothetical protein